MAKKRKGDTVRRRTRQAEPKPDMPSGWRTSRRGSKAGKKARKGIKRHQHKEAVAQAADRTKRTVRDVLVLAGVWLAGIVVLVLALYLLSLGVNRFARWNSVRIAEQESSPEAMAEKARNNLLIIGLDDELAVGFLALRRDGDQEQIYGIAIPDAAFLEVPGQGFERIGDSYISGPDVSLAAVTNFFTVSFTTYITVDYEIYQTALTNQSLAGVMNSVKDTNLAEEDQERWTTAFNEFPTEDVALVPLPVKPINVGSQTYFEPQRDEVADLVKSWWDVTIDSADDTVRVILYNGSGLPGIAGKAAQQLIRGGYRVVDTKNADTFGYAETQIVVQSGDSAEADKIAELLGVGVISEQQADQQVADIIIIIGKDYQEPESISE